MTFRNIFPTVLSIFGLLFLIFNVLPEGLPVEALDLTKKDLQECPDERMYRTATAGSCTCPLSTDIERDNRCLPKCLAEETINTRTCANPNTFRRKFLSVKQASVELGNYLGASNGGASYSGYSFEKRMSVDTPATMFSYNRRYQLVHRGRCLAYPKTDFAEHSYLTLADCADETKSNQFFLEDDGRIFGIDNPNSYISTGVAKYSAPAAMSMFNDPVYFEIIDHPFQSDDCEAGMIKVEGHCVCDPSAPSDTCVNSDGEVCSERRTYRLGSECIPLRTINRINNQFWRYFGTGFWVS